MRRLHNSNDSLARCIAYLFVINIIEFTWKDSLLDCIIELPSSHAISNNIRIKTKTKRHLNWYFFRWYVSATFGLLEWRICHISRFCPTGQHFKVVWLTKSKPINVRKVNKISFFQWNVVRSSGFTSFWHLIIFTFFWNSCGQKKKKETPMTMTVTETTKLQTKKLD